MAIEMGDTIQLRVWHLLALLALLVGFVGFLVTTHHSGTSSEATGAAASPVYGDTDPKARLQAMLNKLSGTGTGDAFLVDDCSTHNDFNTGQSGYDCHVINGITQSDDTWHIEIASDGSGASAWDTAHPDSSTLCDPACGPPGRSAS